MPKINKIKAWAGITNNRLDYGWIEHEKFKDGLFGIFKTRIEAKKHYQKVVPIEIIIKLWRNGK